MEQDIYDVIIVGAGMAGLACANTILEKNNSVKLKIISPQIGGKLITSDNKLFNYGPYFIRDDYHHISKYFKKISRITWSDFMFQKGAKYYPYDLRFLKHLFDHLKFKKELTKFYQEFQKLRQQCLHKPQTTAIKENPYLYALYQQNGLDFIVQHSSKKYFDNYLSYILKAVSFSTPADMNAFHMLSLLLSININSYRYKFDSAGLFKKISHNYLKDTVCAIQETNDGLYQINTRDDKSFKTKQAVIAAGTCLSSRLVGSIAQLINKPNSVYVFHLHGDVKTQFMSHRTHVFDDANEIFVLDRAESNKNEYMVYAKTPMPNFEKLFDKYTITHQLVWENCFHLNGSKLLELELKKNLYIIGDHNIPFMEDVFIYGCYAGQVVAKNF